MAGERSFGDDGFDAGIGSGGLQGDTRAHGCTQGEDMERGRRSAPGQRELVELDGDVFVTLGREQGVDNGAGVVAFEPAVGGNGAFAGPVGAGVHHHDTVSGAKENFRLADDADAVVGNTVKKKNPVAVGIFRHNLPAAQKYPVWCANIEILAVCARNREGSVGLADEVEGELAADGVEECGTGKPSGNGGKERREEQENQQDAVEWAHGSVQGYENVDKRVQAILQRVRWGYPPMFSVSADSKGLKLPVSLLE